MLVACSVKLNSGCMPCYTIYYSATLYVMCVTIVCCGKEADALHFGLQEGGGWGGRVHFEATQTHEFEQPVVKECNGM